MDQPEDDFECLYEDLPEMCDMPSSLCIENSASSSLKEDNAASLILEKISTRDASVRVKENKFTKKCPCRESVQWMWDDENKSRFVEILEDKMDVKFHKGYSNGTAVIRCTEPMSYNQYYWEIKMTGPVYGTDVMVGVGTSEARLQNVEHRFLSLLGMDNTTWGYSYTGLFHHNGLRKCYAQSFTQGNTIGVHLDLWKGTLTFYKDRKSLGVASSGLKGKTLYAMAASTAARSQMRMVYSGSFPSTLQFLCCEKLRELIPEDQNVLDVIDIPPGLKQFLSNKLNWLLDKRDVEKSFSYCCRLINPQREDIMSSESLTEIDSHFSDIPDENPDIDSNVSRQFVLVGTVVFSNHNRFQRAVRSNSSQELEDTSEGDAKRRRYSYFYTMECSDHDSD